MSGQAELDQGDQGRGLKCSKATDTDFGRRSTIGAYPRRTQRGSLTVKTAIDVAGAALALLGNAFAHMTCERRKRVLRDLNKDLLPLAEDEEAFKGAAPLLFAQCS